MPTDRAVPLKPHWLHILVALGERDLHGSGIVRSVLDQTDGSLRLWPVTLYSSLEGMAEEGLIRELRGEDHPEGVTERRRYYTIEARGRAILRSEGLRLAALAELALKRAEEGA
jgi:DNA-binding PadR family transcriptional regulator